MIQKVRVEYLKGFLLGLFAVFTLVCKAQSVNQQVKDSALLSGDSVLQTSLGKDSAKISATVVDLRKKSDFSDKDMSSLLMKMESLILQLNKDIAILRRGFDTLEIGEKIPAIERGLDRFQASLGKMQPGSNIRNLNSIKVALQQAQRMVKRYQETINEYSKYLAKLSENKAKSITDSLLNKMPADSLLRINYLAKFDPVIQKWKIHDSLLTGAIKSIGLLQSRISGSYLKCTELMDEVNGKIKNVQANLLRRDAPFLWQANRSDDGSSLEDNVRFGVKRNFYISLFFLSLNIGYIFFALFLGAIFLFLNQVSVRKLRKADNPGWDLPLHFLKNRIWLPTLLGLFTLLPFNMKNPPAALVESLWLLMLVTATLIRWKDWPVPFRRMWIGIIVFFILFSSDTFLQDTSNTERRILAVLNLGATVLGWFMYKEVLKDKTRYHNLMSESILIFLIINLVSFLMNLTGWVNLARLLSNSASLSITLLLALQIIREILLEFVYLQVEAFKNFNLSGYTEFNKMKEKFRATLGVITIILWILALSWSLSFFDIINDIVGGFLVQRRTLGEFSFSFSSILVFIGVIWISMLLARLVTFIFHGDNSKVTSSRKNKSGSLILFSKLGIYTLGILMAFAATGIPMDKMAIILGALGVGIGFGLQNIVNNLVSGVILAIEKPMEIGDVIEIGTQVGTVKEIGFRSSKIATFDGSVIIVPNGDFISQQLINWTHSNNNYRRVEIIVGVKYGSNLEQVKSIINTIIQEDPDVAKFPEPNILVNEFANNSVNMRILFWTSDYDKWVILKSKIHQEIYESFTENDIEIPLPQTDLHIKSIDPEVAEILRGKAKE